MKSTEFEKLSVIHEIKSLDCDILEIYTSQKILHTKYYITLYNYCRIIPSTVSYCIAGELGDVNVWRRRMDKDFGKKVWQINRSIKRLLIVTANLDGLVWQISDDSPNSSNFPAPNIPAIR